MNIDFSKIIEAANARKNTLLAIQAEIQTSPDMLSQLRAVGEHFDRLRHLWTILDSEGRKLLPVPLQTALGYTEATQVTALIKRGEHIGLQVIAAYAEKAE